MKHQIIQRRRGPKGASLTNGVQVVGLLLLLSYSACLRSQKVERSGCKVDTTHPGWRTYTNREFRFCVQYPPTYHEMAASPPDQYASARRILGSLVLDSLPQGTRGGVMGNKAGIDFVYVPKPFSVKDLQKCCAPTGLDDTPPGIVRLNGRIFYLYGPGGGGVDYPDQFLTEMNGRILDIQFGGPWKDSKAPIEETKKLERVILTTMRTY